MSNQTNGDYVEYKNGWNITSTITEVDVETKFENEILFLTCEHTNIQYQLCNNNYSKKV